MLKDTTKLYLKSPIQSPYLLVLLMLGVLYERVNNLYYKTQLSVYTMALGLFFLWMKIPRWVIYTMFLLMAFGHIYIYTQNYANFDYDATSTRDDAVEAAALVFLDGKNPWSMAEVGPPEARVPVSTGPASILLAIPFVMLFGEINWLATLFWVLFFICLLAGDIHKKNSTFPVLSLLVVIGIFHINLSIQMSLDELYFPIVLLPLAYWAITREKYILVGFLLGMSFLFRMNYIFVAFSFFIWILRNRSIARSDLVKLLVGGFVAILVIILPFWLVGRNEFLSHNFLTFALGLSQASQFPNDIIFYEWLNKLATSLSPTFMGMIKLLIFFGLFWWVTSKMRHLDHPFWHIAIGTFLSLTIAWFPAYNPIDYELLPLLPAFLAVAYSNNTLGTSS